MVLDGKMWIFGYGWLEQMSVPEVAERMPMGIGGESSVTLQRVRVVVRWERSWLTVEICGGVRGEEM